MENQHDKGIKDFINYDNWRVGWYAYMNLLDIDYSGGFCCEMCGSEPQIVVCDATTLGFQRKFARKSFPKILNDERNNVPRRS